MIILKLILKLRHYKLLRNLVIHFKLLKLYFLTIEVIIILKFQQGILILILVFILLRF